MMLLKNNGCDAPCIWGIHPGVSTYGEARNILSQLGLKITFTTRDSDYAFYEFDFGIENRLSGIITFMTQADLVVYVEIFIEPVEQPASEERDWSAYSQETLIRQYGPPEKIDFSLYSIHDKVEVYQFWYGMEMSFSDQALIVQYEYADAQNANFIFHVCPIVDHFDSVFVKAGENPLYAPLPGTGILDAAMITIDEFVQLLNGSPQDVCIDLSGDVFP